MIAALVLAALSATAMLNKQHVEVGEPALVVVKVLARPQAMCTVTTVPDSPPDWTVDAPGQRLVAADDAGECVVSYQITPWADGDLKLPPMQVDVSGVGAAQTNALVIHAVNPVGPDAKDAKEKEIRDILPFPSRPPLWPWVIAGFAIAAGVWLAFRKPRKAAPAPAVELPRAVIAKSTLPELLEAVKKIAENPPRERIAIRDAHFVIAEAVRRFVEEKWEIPASKQTTEEFLAGIAKRQSLRGGGLSILPVVLEACDRVKWAGESVTAQDTLEVAKLALDFFAASRSAVRGLGGETAGSALPPPPAAGGAR